MTPYFDETIDILARALDSVNSKEMDRLIYDSIETLKRNNKIICSGLGKNVPVCDKFVGTMNSLGLSACFMNTNSAAHGDVGMVKDGDLVIILTKSGETVESIYLNQMLEGRNCERWLLTFEDNSTLARKIEKKIVIHLSHEGDKWNIVPNNSTTLNMIVLQTIAMQIAEKMEIPLERFKMNHPGGHIGDILRDGKGN